MRMRRRTTTREEENDDFWTIALQHDDGERTEDLADEDDEDDDGAHDLAKPTIYRIPSMMMNNNDDDDDDDENGEFTTLRLCPLPSTEGVWSPVGADAWYASALLASLFLSHNVRHPFSNIFSASSSCNLMNGATAGDCPRTIIELGSGAVGLSGFVCALALEAYHHHHYHKQQSNHNNTGKNGVVAVPAPTWKVLLTDNDAPVLRQLERNLQANHAVLTSRTMRNVHIEVVAWDWKEDSPAHEALQPNNNNNVVLVVGSELVYTEETAKACVHLLIRLLQQYPDVEIWIVQVVDRYGWWDIVVPTLHQQNDDICVDSIPLTPEIHNRAMRMVPMGGALDRHAYGAFCIYNKQTNNSKPLTSS